MINEDILDQLEKYGRHGVDGISWDDIANEVYSLARLGLWAEKHGVDALHGILSNVGLDWYMQQFGKDETPNGLNSGIASRIHNIETKERVVTAFLNANSALAALPRKKNK